MSIAKRMSFSFALIYGLLACSTAGGAASSSVTPVNPEVSQSPAAQAETHKIQSDTIEKSLAWLPGKFMVVGQEPDSGKTYSGSVSITRQGDRLFVQKIIQGGVISGMGTIMFEPEAPVLEVEYHVGLNTVRAGYEFSCGDKNQPRASGWVSPVDGDLTHRSRLGLEVWYYDQAVPSPPSVPNQAPKDSSKRSTASDLLGLFEGRFRVIGQELGSGKIYTGTVTAKSDGLKLAIKRTVNGQVTHGELDLNLSADDRFSLVAKYRVGREMVFSMLNHWAVGDNYPRLSGYFYSADASGKAILNDKPTLETWFYDWR
jgi:hypothetical protein